MASAGVQGHGTGPPNRRTSIAMRAIVPSPSRGHTHKAGRGVAAVEVWLEPGGLFNPAIIHLFLQYLANVGGDLLAFPLGRVHILNLARRVDKEGDGGVSNLRVDLGIPLLSRWRR